MPTSLIRVSSQPAETCCDVVFVHGLSGDGIASWQAKGVNGTWMHWLAEDHPETAVWTLDYTAQISSWQAEGVRGKFARQGPGMAIPDLATTALNVLRNHEIGDRPVVFICHSLGGLVIKQALRTAATMGFSDYEPLSAHTRGVAFLATPHTGSALATAAKFLPGLTRTTRTVLELEEHSPNLADLNDWYRQNAPEMQIRTIALAEWRPISGTVIVVNRTSADPNVPNVQTIPIADVNHSTIAKPDSRDTQVFMVIDRFIRDTLPIRDVGPARSTTIDLKPAFGQATKSKRWSQEADWDIFIAHAGADMAQAEELFDLLREHCHVFLASRTLNLGDDWDIELPAAQRSSHVSAVLVSDSTDTAFYQREEIAHAIELSRRGEHVVVPIYLHGTPSGLDVPYGLRVKQGMSIGEGSSSIADAAERLLALIIGGAQPEDVGSDVQLVDQLKRELRPALQTIRDFREEGLIEQEDSAVVTRSLLLKRLSEGLGQ